MGTTLLTQLLCVSALLPLTSSLAVRLVNGISRCSGRVEVKRPGREWGTVCDDSWDLPDAEVVCRQLRCGSALSATTEGYFGEGTGKIIMNSLACLGNETSLGDCAHRGFYDHTCAHDEDAGVICSGNLRLVGGSEGCSGRVEMLYAGQWGAVCTKGFSSAVAQEVCRELGCVDLVSIPEAGQYGWSQSGAGTGYQITCTDKADSRCTPRQFFRSGCGGDAAVVCSGGVRLANGPDRCSGRVEFHHRGEWGTVCERDWDPRDAGVVCRELGCGPAVNAKHGAYFGEGSGEIWLSNVACVGDESRLSRCPQNPSGFGTRSNHCHHSDDAGVKCSGNLRLVDGRDKCAGRVEVFHDGQWGPVYHDSWGGNEAQVVCRHLDCGDAVAAPEQPHFGPSRAVAAYNVSCSGEERNISQCSLTAYNKPQAAVTCTGNMRLVNGTGGCSGRVEIYHDGQWGTVCDRDWDLKDAEVVCRQLGCGRAVEFKSDAFFGPGDGEVWIRSVECTGDEVDLTHCPHSGFGNGCWFHEQDAGVICKGRA